MTKKKATNRRVQAAKPRSPEAHDLRLSGRGGAGDRIPSGKAYKRPKAGGKGRDW